MLVDMMVQMLVRMMDKRTDYLRGCQWVHTTV